MVDPSSASLQDKEDLSRGSNGTNTNITDKSNTQKNNFRSEFIHYLRCNLFSHNVVTQSTVHRSSNI